MRIIWITRQYKNDSLVHSSQIIIPKEITVSQNTNKKFFKKWLSKKREVNETWTEKSTYSWKG